MSVATCFHRPLLSGRVDEETGGFPSDPAAQVLALCSSEISGKSLTAALVLQFGFPHGTIIMLCFACVCAHCLQPESKHQGVGDCGLFPAKQRPSPRAAAAVTDTDRSARGCPCAEQVHASRLSNLERGLECTRYPTNGSNKWMDCSHPVYKTGYFSYLMYMGSFQPPCRPALAN